LGSVEGDLWKEVLDSKYGGWRNLNDDKSMYNASLWWKDLKKIWKWKGGVVILETVVVGKLVMEKISNFGKTSGLATSH